MKLVPRTLIDDSSFVSTLGSESILLSVILDLLDAQLSKRMDQLV